MTARIRAHLMPLAWESDFFALPSARLSFSDDAPALTLGALNAYALVQAKVSASDLATIDALSVRGFQLAESEVDFCLPIDSGEVVLPAWRVADTADIAPLRDAAARVFLQSRFRAPWYCAADSGRFYAQWVENAVRGTFDDVCLIAHDAQGAPLGWVTLRQTQADQARIGLLAAWSGTAGGQGMPLMALARHWCQQRHVAHLWVATQLGNTRALRLYQRSGAQIHDTAHWFYRRMR
ncbi:dTDP-4-amino-4,6-dideoxy-D-galactose acyltransferase [Symbiopectobacterium purcellii]|uniref:dTDP-4-amino-4,6-dideoxy-D-galactose acyltransferase n=1 Tax=Symbiopectobacterium purcellii TaxID=2871826 RepID=UPI003F82CD83